MCRLSISSSSSKNSSSSNDWATKANARQSPRNNANFMLLLTLHEFTVDCEITKEFFFNQSQSWIIKKNVNANLNKQNIHWRRKSKVKIRWSVKPSQTVSNIPLYWNIYHRTRESFNDESKYNRGNLKLSLAWCRIEMKRIFIWILDVGS